MPVMIDCPSCGASFKTELIQAKTEEMFRTNPIIGGELEETCPKCGKTFKLNASSYYWRE
jgi:uncharacterized C2H2 Zn-finger protein